MTASRLLASLAIVSIVLQGAVAEVPGRPPIKVKVFFESLCPYCKDFLATTFADGWSAVPEILNVTLVPWGFAKATPSGEGWNFTCQHGPLECIGNKKVACGAKLAPSHAQSVDFTICLETGRDSESKCALASHIRPNDLTQCVNDPATDVIMLKYRDMTEEEQPPVGMVPCISVDGSHDHQLDIHRDFRGFVCGVWKATGGSVPPGCM